MAEIGAKAQGYAIDVEHIMSKVFECNRFDVGGIVNSDYIRRNWQSAITATCTYVYANTNSTKRKEVERFLDEKSLYLNMSLEELLSFDESTKSDGIIEITIGYENGEKAVAELLKEFNALCSD